MPLRSRAQCADEKHEAILRSAEDDVRKATATAAGLKTAAMKATAESKERAQARLPMLPAIQEAFSSAAATNSE
jgi:hypothetical protein